MDGDAHMDITKHRITNRRAQAKALAELQANPNDPRHGTLHGWSAGCRCKACGEAGTEYKSEYYAKYRDAIRAKQRAKYRENNAEYIKLRRIRQQRYLDEMSKDPDDPRHGRTGYVYGCRCDKCKAGNKAYREERKKNES